MDEKKEYFFEDKGYTKDEFLKLAEEHRKAGIKSAVVAMADGMKKTADSTKKTAEKPEA